MFFSKKKEPEFPNDDDGDVLRSLWKRGVDFSIPHNVDFPVAVSDEDAGEKLITILHDNGFECTLEQDEESGVWTIYCMKRMVLQYQELMDIQVLLSKLGEPFGAYSDGWGTFGD